MWTKLLKFGLLGICALALAACGTSNTTSSTGTGAPTATANVSGTGVVQAIDVVPKQAGGPGLGTVGGAVVGGLLGNQVGSGGGRTAATIAGAAGGAYAGRQMEKRSQAGAGEVYRVTVRMDDGSLQALAQETAPQVNIGDRVRLENGVIVERLR